MTYLGSAVIVALAQELPNRGTYGGEATMDQLLEGLRGPTLWALGIVGSLALGVVGNLLTPIIRSLPTLVRSGLQASRVERFKAAVRAQLLAEASPQWCLAFLIQRATATLVIIIAMHLLLQGEMVDEMTYRVRERGIPTDFMLAYGILVVWSFLAIPSAKMMHRLGSPRRAHRRLADRATSLGLDYPTVYAEMLKQVERATTFDPSAPDAFARTAPPQAD